MNNTISHLAKVTHKLTQIALYVSATGLFLMTLIIGWQVFARYVLNSSPAWSESAALLLMLYYIMLAAAVGVYEGFHLGLKILIDSVSPKVKRLLEMFNNSLIIVFGLSMLVNGSKLAQFTSDHIIPTLNISRAFAYWPFAAAGLLISIFAFERLLIIALKEED